MPAPDEDAEGAIDVRDPLESMRNATLGFGGILIIVSAVGVVRRLASGEEAEDADIWRAWGFLALVAIVTGPAVAFVRIRMRGRSMRAKNAGTGVVAGLIYAGAGMTVVGDDMPLLARCGLGAFVAGGLAWAIASGLNEGMASLQPTPPKRGRKAREQSATRRVKRGD